MFSLYLTYFISITLLISSPGPIVSLVISDSKYGWPSATIWAGAISALLLLATSLLMIHFTLAIDENILDWGRVVGGGYLAYLGISILLSPISIDKSEYKHTNCFWRTMRAGLSNPKDILFFLAFLPSFIVPDTSFIEQSIYFLIIWAFVDVSVMIVYAGVAKKLFSYSYFHTLLHYIPGVFMLFVGGASLYLGGLSLMG